MADQFAEAVLFSSCKLEKILASFFQMSNMKSEKGKYGIFLPYLLLLFFFFFFAASKMAKGTDVHISHTN